MRLGYFYLTEDEMEKQTINIEDFFTEDREEEGVWFEPKVNGESCGLQFLVTGFGSNENAAGAERYDKERDELDELKDPVEKVKKRKELDARRVAEFIKGIRAADGCEVNFGGKPIESSRPVAEKIFLNAPLIRDEIIRFAKTTTNFIKREKNDLEKQ